jgi:Tfp pilus assembly protein PilW
MGIPMVANRNVMGFTLVELVVTMALTVLLIGGVSSVYFTLKQTSAQVSRLENAQEVLRTTHQVLYRSTLQATGVVVTLSDASFTQAASATACDGSQPAMDFTERYFQLNNNLICTLNTDVTQDIVLLTDLQAIEFALTTDPVIGSIRLTVSLAPDGLPENFPILALAGQNLPGVQLEFALKTLIMNWAT